MEKHITWADDKERKLENAVLQEYSKDEVSKHLNYLTTLIRRAGTDDELKASKYIGERLSEYGVESNVHEVEAFISLPGNAELEILSPVRKKIPALPRIFIASTSPEGMETQLVFAGRGVEEDYAGLDVREKIVLVDVGGMEGRMEAARIGQQKGAGAQVHITSGRPRTINFGQFRTTWGPPTPETLDQIPRTPAVSICREDGDELIALLKSTDRVQVRLKAEAWRGYTKIRIPLATIPGSKEPEKFVLMGGHYCSWFTGATDNAAANSMMLEMVRVLSRHRKDLRRSARFAWWSGHEQGTYAGSTWYLDRHWDDIRDHAVAYLVVDGLGRQGSSGFSPQNTEEIRKFQEQLVREITGVEAKSKRVERFGDQSYWGIGLPSMTGNTISEKGVWYSHAEEDTLDKVDLDLLTVPFKVYSAAILRLCNNPVFPFEFTTTMQLYGKALRELQAAASKDWDLSSLISLADGLQKKTESLSRKVGRILLPLKDGRAVPKQTVESVNRSLMDLSRLLLPVLSTKAGKYGQDPMGIRFEPLPSLQPIGKLGEIDASSEEARALRASLLRERNRVSDTLDSADRILSCALKILTG